MKNLLERPFMKTRPSYMPKYWPVPSSCVLYLEGQQDAYSSTIKDLSGNGNDGTITGATWERRPSGLWGLDFDGEDDRVDCGADNSLNFTTTDFTLMAWVKETGVVTDNTIFSRGAYNASGYWWLLDHVNQWVTFGTHQAGASQRSYSTANAIVEGQDTFLSVTKIGTGVGSVKLFQNGIDHTDTQGDHADPLTSAKTPYLGMYSEGGYVMDGLIYLFRAFARGFSPAEILSVFNQERHLFGV